MEYTKSLGGAWLNAEEIQVGDKIKIVSECTKQQSSFKDPKTGEPKMQNIAKVSVGGKEAVNCRLNWTTIYGLIDAFGSDSKEWIGNELSIKTIEAMVGDTMRTIVYLIPEGFDLIKNEEKKMEVRKVAKEEKNEDIKPEDIPF